jgi:hypothetical protein
MFIVAALKPRRWQMYGLIENGELLGCSPTRSGKSNKISILDRTSNVVITIYCPVPVNGGKPDPTPKAWRLEGLRSFNGGFSAEAVKPAKA